MILLFFSILNRSHPAQLISTAKLKKNNLFRVEKKVVYIRKEGIIEMHIPFNKKLLLLLFKSRK